jgi:hypothetical protein
VCARPRASRTPPPLAAAAVKHVAACVAPATPGLLPLFPLLPPWPLPNAITLTCSSNSLRHASPSTPLPRLLCHHGPAAQQGPMLWTRKQWAQVSGGVGISVVGSHCKLHLISPPRFLCSFRRPARSSTVQPLTAVVVRASKVRLAMHVGRGPAGTHMASETDDAAAVQRRPDVAAEQLRAARAARSRG